MFGSLLVGVLLAIGHAVFYWWLNGKEVDKTLAQTWVTNIGTIFAFLIKMVRSLKRFVTVQAGTNLT